MIFRTCVPTVKRFASSGSETQALLAQTRKVLFVAKLRSGLSQLRDRYGPACGLSVEPLNDRAVNRELRVAERRSCRKSRDQAILRIGENLELFSQLLTVAP